MKLKLYRISQKENTRDDTYGSAVVAAESEELAKRINPGEFRQWSDEHRSWMRFGKKVLDNSWVDDLGLVNVECLGEAAEGIEAGVICASFNAG